MIRKFFLAVTIQLSSCITPNSSTQGPDHSPSPLSLDPSPPKVRNHIDLNGNGTLKTADLQHLDSLPAVRMPEPSFEGTSPQVTKTVNAIPWKLLHSKRNKITDDSDWFQTNNLPAPFCTISNAEHPNSSACMPQTSPSYNGRAFTEGIVDENFEFHVYGSTGREGHILVMVNRKTRKVEKIYDFELYMHAPKVVPEARDYVTQSIRWARCVGDTLYISHAHRTYAKSSFGQNAYITAIDLKTDQVQWRTKPLLSNSLTFEIIDGVIVTGYGFTAEKHFLYQINRFTGEKISELLIRKSPEYIIRKANTLFVRTYDTDLEYELPPRE